MFVAPTPRPGRGKQSADIERLLEEPTAVAELMGQLIGEPAAAMLRSRPELVEAARAEMLAKLDQDRQSPAPPPTKRWAVSDRYAGIERAQLVIVNVRDQEDSRRADELVFDLAKLRQDQKIFSDVLGYRGNRISITAVAGNVTDPADPGTKKAIAKVRRLIQSRAV